MCMCVCMSALRTKERKCERGRFTSWMVRTRDGAMVQGVKRRERERETERERQRERETEREREREDRKRGEVIEKVKRKTYNEIT